MVSTRQFDWPWQLWCDVGPQGLLGSIFQFVEDPIHKKWYSKIIQQTLQEHNWKIKGIWWKHMHWGNPTHLGNSRPNFKETTVETTTEKPKKKVDGSEVTIKLRNQQSSTWDMEKLGEQDIDSSSKNKNTKGSKNPSISLTTIAIAGKLLKDCRAVQENITTNETMKSMVVVPEL